MLEEWASEQAKLLVDESDTEKQLEAAGIVRALGGSTSQLIIAIHQTGPISLADFENLIRGKYNEIIVVGDSSFSLLERDNGKIILNENVFVANPGIPGIIQTRREDFWVTWPERNFERFDDYSISGILQEAFSQLWEIPLNSMIKASDISSDDQSYSRIIGEVNGFEIECNHVDILRVPM